MHTRSKIAKSIMLAGIPLLTLPMLAESGMSRDRSMSMSNQQQEIVQGEIFRKDGEEITLRSSDGERIRFRVTDQTNKLCPKGSSGQSGQSSSMKKEGTMSMGSSFSSSGQSTSSSSNQASTGSQEMDKKSGWSFGDCSLQNGDFVKAKVDQDGKATYVRSMGRADDNYFQAGRSGEDYFVLPAGQLGGLDISDQDANYTVKSSDGEAIGSIYRVMTNQEGDLTYAIVREKEDGHLISVPWQALEGAGNKTFKLNVSKNQLGNLPIMEEGESAGTHVQKHWDLTDRQRKNLAQWNERLDDRYEVRDRYYEDTPTFRDNREGYDRYDYDRSRDARRNRSQGEDRYSSRRDSERYPQLGSRPGVAGERGTVSMFGSPSTLPPGEFAPQYEGADRQQRSFDRGRHTRFSDEFQQRRDRGRSMNTQSRERNFGMPADRYEDRFQSTTSPRRYDPQRQGADRYQSRRSDDRNYDYRPDRYRP